MFSTTDTIAAIATPTGRGGIGVVRVSGPDAQRIAGEILARAEPLAPRVATFGRVRLEAGPSGVGDQVVVTAFPAPHSYTSEDTIEISAHGSPVVLAAILEACVRAGARLAAPGEFTFRAYLHGRIELTQAEAVADLVDAVTPLQARAAFDQLEGSLATAICGVSGALLDLTARLEASLDFPEEGYHFIEPAEVRSDVAAVLSSVRSLLERAEEGRVIREGRRVVIAGPVNAGKSSLFNRLADMDRAIVAASPGTTRDLLVERIDLAGVPVTLVDTAGLRASEDEVEAEGVRRAQRAVDVAAVTVFVLDRSAPLEDVHRELLSPPNRAPAVFVANKSDLPARWAVGEIAAPDGAPWVETSARTGEGIAALRDAIGAALGLTRIEPDPPRVTNIRHIALLRDAAASLDVVLNDLSDPEGPPPEEVLLEALAEARSALEQISGVRTPEDVLNHIFERFCIGK